MVSVFYPYTDAAGEFLSNLSEDEVATVLSYTQARRYRAGEAAVHEAERDRSLYIVTAGSFEALVPSASGYQSARAFRAGDMFGELAFFDNQPRSADVRAVEDAEALIMTPAGFDRLRLAHPRLALSFVMDLGRILSVRFRDYNLRLAALGEL